MTTHQISEGDLGDYVDPTVKYVPLEPVPNTMNDIDPAILAKYLDPEFMNAKPDEKTIEIEQLQLEAKERMDIDFDLDDDLEQALEDEQLKTARLQPREYQYELFTKALEENVIAVLDTGSGKTLISIMLIKQMVLQERQERLTRRETKLAFFLVDRVPLVFQQASVIRANCDVNLEEMCGEMDVDAWSEKRWKLIFEENDVCVMTAQIFLDTLHHGFISLEKVHLLIFDECHHATKKHPFNLIMREFYDRCPFEHRPKIFGMTASPMHARTTVERSVAQLEKNLNARVYTAANMENLDISIPKPREYSIHYDPTPRYEETEMSKKIREKLGSIGRYKRCFIITHDILTSMGPWCSDRMWKSILSELERRMSNMTQDLERDALIDEDLALKETHEFVDPIEFPRNPDVFDRSLFSPKVAELIRLLQFTSQRIPDFCCIIFVERRHTAKSLQTLIESLDILNNIRCDSLTGHGSTEEGDVQMTFGDQNKIINKFRSGELNLLIATNVAEEGLDIQPCNVVFRFDFFHTLISYIQSRGRARKEGSKFIILTEANNASQESMLAEFGQLEADMKAFCQTIPEERNVASKYAISMDVDYDSDEDYISDEEDNFLSDAFIVPETGAIITKQNAVPLIHKYCSSLPSDSFCVLKPIFENIATGEGFICKLILPSNAPFQEIESHVCGSKDLARASVALNACIRLRELDALDKHLLPRNIRREILGDMAPQYDKNGYIIGSRRRHGLYEKRTPKFWERPSLMEEEEEEIDVEDNPDLLKAQVYATAISDRKSLEPTPNQDVPTATEADQEAVVPQQANGVVHGETLTEDQQTEVQTEGQDAATKEEEEKEEEEKEEEELGEGPFSCYFTVLEVQLPDNQFEHIPLRRLCLISKKPFPTLSDLKLFHKSMPFYVHLRNVSTEIIFDREKILQLSEYMKKLLAALINKEFHCPIVEIPYFIVPLVKHCEDTAFETLPPAEFEALIDWAEVDKIIESKSTPFSLEDYDATDSIVMDQSDNMRRYFVTKVRTDMSPQSPVPDDVKIRETGYATFADYYNEKKLTEGLDTNQPMLEIRRLKKIMNFLYPGQIVPAQMKGPTSTWTVPSFCQRFFMSASVYQATMMIPSIMTRIDSILLCRQSAERYDLPIDDANMLEAYTTPSASMEMNYERLETLGDSLLKFIATIRLYINFPFSNEGELHHLRIRVICNRALYRSAKRLKFYRYVTSQAFNRRYWRPPGFTSPADNQETIDSLKYHKLSDKTLADIVEASLGAAYLSNGLEGGLHAAIQLQIPFDEIKTWDDFKPTFEESRKQVPARAEVRALRSLDLPKVTKIVGREFQTPLLIVEALTHASLPNSTSPCYQRLEFLGDAILDFMVIRYLFAKYPDADPGIITDLKDSCVNNHILGIVCVETGLYRHIIHYSGKLIRAIEFFVSEVEETKAKGEAVGEYWVDFNIPKVLSDVVESMLGATFVDAGFRLEAVEELFAKWFLPILDNHVTPELIKFHPLRKLITDLQRFGCDSFMLRNHGSGETGPESQKCVIFLHDKPLATGSDWNIKTARRHAATKASQRLEDEPGLLESICNCRVSMVKRGLIQDDRAQRDLDDDEDDP